MNIARLQDLVVVDNIKTGFRKSWKASWKRRQGKTLTPTPQAAFHRMKGANGMRKEVVGKPDSHHMTVHWSSQQAYSNSNKMQLYNALGMVVATEVCTIPLNRYHY
ncbi:unnamed protein product [Taenia asiatica]|uniref:Transposase n=1 Tax=Taenia asiatica TaxID=60517 RepID=A0A0R3W342_TAEAS|nr:unnamed protein product [Taenia asiatica]